MPQIGSLLPLETGSADLHFWESRRKSRLWWIPASIWGAAMMAGYIWVENYNQRSLGLPDPGQAGVFWAVLFFGRIISVTIHSAGRLVFSVCKELCYAARRGSARPPCH